MKTMLTPEACRLLPKVELHAHLSGSVAQEQLTKMHPAFKQFNIVKEMKEANGKTANGANAINGASNGSDDTDAITTGDAIKMTTDDAMKRCFSYFAAVSQVITNLDALRMVTQHVLQGFRNENTVYLELRTTPKAFPGNTRVDYVRVVQECVKEIDFTLGSNGAIHEGNAASDGRAPQMIVRLLLSIDRGRIQSLHDAEQQIKEVVDLAEQFPDFVVGIDICGNPGVASIVPYLIPALEAFLTKNGKDYFYTKNLPITWHLGEHEDAEEIDQVLNRLEMFNVRRVGHVCFLSPSQTERIIDHVVRVSNVVSSSSSNQIGLGVELCPSSNFVTKALPSMQSHHLRNFFGKGNCRVCLCTDDSGLFCCDLTSEVCEMADSFSLKIEDLKTVQLNAISTSFLRDPKQKERIQQKIVLEYDKLSQKIVLE